MRSLLAVAALCAAACQAQAGERARLVAELRATADVGRTNVVLSDIATLHGADADRLASLPVGVVSATGEPTVVERQALARWVQARLGVRQDIAWSGAARCRVQLVAGAGAAPVQPAARDADPERRTPAAAGGTPLVLKGAYATLNAGAGAIRLESRVEVLQDGALGQDVRVRLPNATDAVVARVVGQGRVEVTE
jgi:hypothetical protein